MMTPEQRHLLERRQADFPAFFEELMPCLVDFIGKMGVTPAHQVLRQAPAYVTFLSAALQNMVIADQDDRNWLLPRLGYFIGEYFTQKYGGAWYVNANPSSRNLARYVVGQFNIPSPRELNIDPFAVADAYISAATPRALLLEKLLQEAEQELIQFA